MTKERRIPLGVVGRCIYCGSSDDLSEEHILTFALGANMTLEEASCPACREITGQVEGQITRPIAGMLRIRLGIQSRRPKLREAIPKVLYFGDERRIVNIDPAEFPCLFTYPIFHRPGILDGHRRQGVYRGRAKPWSLGQDADYKRVADAFMAKFGCSGFELGSFRPAILMPFVAKVAHASAVALLGEDGFEPLVKEAAVRPDAHFDDVLGGTGGLYRPERDLLHLVELFQGDGPAGKLIIAQFRWFANLSSRADSPLSTDPGSAPPPFLAVVGRPVDDRLSGKVGFVRVSSNGEETWGIKPLSDRRSN